MFTNSKSAWRPGGGGITSISTTAAFHHPPYCFFSLPKIIFDSMIRFDVRVSGRCAIGRSGVCFQRIIKFKSA